MPWSHAQRKPSKGWKCRGYPDIGPERPAAMDVGRLHGLQVLPAVVTQTKVELVSSHRLLDDVVVTIELI